MNKKTHIIIFAVLVIVAVTVILVPKNTDNISIDNIGYAAHPVYSSFEQPINAFSIDRTAVLFSSSDTQQSLTITTNDTAVYSTAYISINSGAWQQVTLTGTTLGGVWLTGHATGTMTIPKSSIAEGTSNENYIIIYSCTRNSSGWDCHDQKWQLQMFNTSKNTESQNIIIYAINAGGPQYTSTVDGTTYSADSYYTGGNTLDLGSTINSPDGTLYSSERWGLFSYNFPVTNADYEVTLKFAELYYGPSGQRLFNVSIEGQRVLTQFDMVQAAAGPNKTVDRTFNVTVDDGSLDISFEKGSADYPKIGAIVITSLTGNITGNSSNNTVYTCTGQDNQPCAITNGQGIQYRTCNSLTGNWSTYGICTITGCNSGYFINGSSCSSSACTGSDNQPCAITNGQGIQYRTCTNGNWSIYGTCTVQSCDNGYTQSGNTCIDASVIQPIINPYGKVYYISSSGNDSSNGTSVNSPWKTLAKVSSASLKPGDIIAFKRGDTFYGSMNITSSGNKSYPITFDAYGIGDMPIITGFTAVTGWTNKGSNIWESTNTVSNLPQVNMLTVNGVNTAMGRYPKANAANGGYLTFQSHSGMTSITSSDLTGTPNWAGAEIVIRPESYVLERSTITSQSGGTLNFGAISTTPKNDSGFFFQDDMKTLTTQNDWYYNTTNHKILMYSTGQPGDVEVASIEKTVIVQGNYLSFRNINFTGANGCALYSLDGIYHHITVTNSSFSDIGISAIYLYSNYIDIEENTFTDMNNAFSAVYAGYNITIRNNNLKNIGILAGMKDTRTYAWSNSAVELLRTGDFIFEYNNVQNVGYNGIYFYGKNILVKNNYFNNFCTVVSDGGAIYTYTGYNLNDRPLMSNVTITGNIAVNAPYTGDGTSYPLSASGIYLDYASANVEIAGNSIANTQQYGIFICSSGNVNVHDNNVYNASQFQLYYIGYDANTVSSSDHVKYNTLVAAKKEPSGGTNYWNVQKAFGIATYTGSATQESDAKKVAHDMDYNIYARPISDDEVFWITLLNWGDDFMNLAQWRTWSGQDAHSSGSPKSVSTLNDIRFEYNPTKTTKTVTLDVPYIDMKNVTYTGSVTLQPFTSITLIKK